MFQESGTRLHTVRKYSRTEQEKSRLYREVGRYVLRVIELVAIQPLKEKAVCS